MNKRHTLQQKLDLFPVQASSHERYMAIEVMIPHSWVAWQEWSWKSFRTSPDDIEIVEMPSWPTMKFYESWIFGVPWDRYTYYSSHQDARQDVSCAWFRKLNPMSMPKDMPKDNKPCRSRWKVRESYHDEHQISVSIKKGIGEPTNCLWDWCLWLHQSTRSSTRSERW